MYLIYVLSGLILFGYCTGIIGLYRFRTSDFRVHTCGAASLVICWTMVILAFAFASDLWIGYGVLIWAMIQTWVMPITAQLWRSIENQ